MREHEKHYQVLKTPTKFRKLGSITSFFRLPCGVVTDERDKHRNIGGDLVGIGPIVANVFPKFTEHIDYEYTEPNTHARRDKLDDEKSRISSMFHI
ncbi:MAG: hypothetical protein MN733_30345 [Nitrososphaera sp.]|nr:hypothetical protein [Nitrososphaera sp.]